MPSIREIAKKQTMDAAETMCRDASFILAEKLDWRPEEHGKSVNMILSECAKANMGIAAYIRGDEPSGEVESADFASLKDCLVASAQQVCDAIDSLSDEAIEGDVKMPWGAIYPAGEAIFLPISHMTYHDGQINYIQVLLGDTKFHWAEE
ncbi:MAG TPA: DinB family protein [Armatimonadota bacterium]|jgi:uncharacterized damage-inducible protein DinB